MLVAFSVTPLGVGENVGEIVEDAVRVARASGLPNRTDAMFTTVEVTGTRSWSLSRNNEDCSIRVPDL